MAIDVGVVCVHGFTGSPADLDFLRARLGEAGFTATAPLLPGHGTTVEDLDRRRWSEWVDAVDAEVTTAGRNHARVAVVGQSLGALLALHVTAHRREVACVASLAAPLWLSGIAKLAATWSAKLGIRSLPKLGGADVSDPEVKRAAQGYNRIPVRALGQLVAFMRVVDDELATITQPVLVLHAANDHTAPVACATRIAERTRARRLRILPRSYHLIASDVERDIVADEVVSFIRREAGA